MYLIITQLLLIISSAAIKVSPPTTLNLTSFEDAVGTSLTKFLAEGSKDHKPWFFFFKLKDCPHCKQAKIVFDSLFVEYQRRVSEQEKDDTLINVETDFKFASIDCAESYNICHQFNIEQYPTFLITEGDGKVCVFDGLPMPHQIITYFQERVSKGNTGICKVIGHITFWIRIKNYFQPIAFLFDQNTLLFMIAFVIGPFLFGYASSRAKRQKQQQIQDKIQKKQ